jgi:hypothetical protein
MPSSALRNNRSAYDKDTAPMKILLLTIVFGIILLMAHIGGPAPLRLPQVMRMLRLLPASRTPSNLG